MAGTMWRCEAHGSDWYRDWCVMTEMARREGHRVVDLDPCRMVEVEICAVGAKRSPAEVRAAVVPLLDLEAAAEAICGAHLRHAVHARRPCSIALKQAKRAVYAALGLGEDE